MLFTYNISGNSENGDVNLTIVHKEAWIFHNGCRGDSEDEDFIQVTAHNSTGQQLDMTRCNIILESCPGPDSTTLPCYWKIQ